MAATLVPYLCVHDTRAAIRWYHDAFGATVIGRPIEMKDGTIGYAELAVFGARIVLSDPSPVARVTAADPSRFSSIKLHLTVPDCDSCVTRCRRAGAIIESEPQSSGYGRGAAILDPFGHRWLVVQPVSQVADTEPSPAVASAERGHPPRPRTDPDRDKSRRRPDRDPRDGTWRTAAPMPTPYPLPGPTPTGRTAPSARPGASSQKRGPARGQRTASDSTVTS